MGTTGLIVALGVGLMIAMFAIIVAGFYMLIVGIYDTFVANKASFWSIVYLVVGFVMVFGGIGGNRARANKTERRSYYN